MGRLPSNSRPRTPRRLVPKMTSFSSMTLEEVDKAFAALGLSRSNQPTIPEIHRARQNTVRARNLFVLPRFIQ